MKLRELKGKKLLPIRDLVAFKWIKPKLKSGIIIPDKYYNLGLQLGKFYIGEVLVVGPKVKKLKPKDKILVAEYGIKDFRGGWKEDEIYFIEERFINAKISGFASMIERLDSEKDINRPVS